MSAESTDYIVKIKLIAKDLAEAKIRLGYLGLTDEEFLGHMAVYYVKHRAGIWAEPISVEKVLSANKEP